MSANHLPDSLMTGEYSIATETIRPGMGYGYDCAVFTDPLLADDATGKGNCFWLGAADTWFWIDPMNDLIFIGMTQRFIGAGQPDVKHFSRPIVYWALIDPRR